MYCAITEELDFTMLHDSCLSGPPYTSCHCVWSFMCVVKMCVTGKAPKDIRPQLLTLSGPVYTSSLRVPTELNIHHCCCLCLYLSTPLSIYISLFISCCSESKAYALVCVCFRHFWMQLVAAVRTDEELIGTTHLCVYMCLRVWGVYI